MSQKKDDFWDEFMKDIDLEPYSTEKTPPKEPAKPAAPEPSSGEAPVGMEGLKIEYVSRDGDVIRTEEPVKAPEPDKQPAPPEKPREPVRRPEPKPAPVKKQPEKSVLPYEKKPAKPARQPKPYNYKPKKPIDKSKFEVDFDYDGEYEDVNERFVKRGQGRRTGCLGGIMFFLFVVCVSVVLAALLWMAAVDVLALGKEPGEVTVTVPKSIFSTEERTITAEDGTETKKSVTVADIDWVADMLYDNELIQYKDLFKLFCRFARASEKVKAGTYVLSRDYDYRALISGMNPNGGERVTIDVTIPEGYTVAQIVSYLDEKGICDENEMWDALANHEFDYDFLDPETLGDRYRLEGYLFPDTYTFYLGDTPTRVISKLLTNFKNKWTAEMTEKAAELGYTQREILTIASMIEKEAGVDKDRAAIASVIYNRLENVTAAAGTYGYLQIDATIHYAVSRTGEEFSTELDDPYNTYRYPGLPAGPIANPGLASIKAALNPESTNYYYYALAKDRSHRFFRTFEEQQAFVHSDEYGG